MIRLKIRKIGNHWLPCVNFEYEDNIFFDEKLEKYLNLINKHQGDWDEINIVLDEADPNWEILDVMTVDTEDIMKYVTTDENLYMRIYMNNHEFIIHSDLYTILINQFDLKTGASYQIYLT